jgi:ubiquinone/menaquinone biosynthesis C-methylase UbiE
VAGRLAPPDAGLAAPARDLVVSDDLPFTGERFVPGVPGEIWLEHWHRYHFAVRWAAGKRVLDVACGEGYGSALLARRAAQVTGVDVSEAAIGHARAAYAGRSNPEFVTASCTRLPFADAAFDTVVSFETIEHIGGQDAFLDEVARVLAPGGVLVLSCPNKLEYSDKRDYTNEFHVKELYREELARMVSARFPEIAWFGQRPTFYSVIAPEQESSAAGELFEVTEADPAVAASALASPLYFLLVASRAREAIAAPSPAVSVLADRDDWMYRDYAKVLRELRASAGHCAELEARAAAACDEASAASASLTELRAKAAAADADLEQKQREIDRRGGLRWWLRLPLQRIGLLK